MKTQQNFEMLPARTNAFTPIISQLFQFLTPAEIATMATVSYAWRCNTHGNSGFFSSQRVVTTYRNSLNLHYLNKRHDIISQINAKTNEKDRLTMLANDKNFSEMRFIEQLHAAPYVGTTYEPNGPMRFRLNLKLAAGCTLISFLIYCAKLSDPTELTRIPMGMLSALSALFGMQAAKDATEVHLHQVAVNHYAKNIGSLSSAMNHIDAMLARWKVYKEQQSVKNDAFFAIRDRYIAQQQAKNTDWVIDIHEMPTDSVNAEVQALDNVANCLRKG